MIRRTGGGFLWAAAVELLLCRRVAILRALAVLGTVLPAAARTATALPALPAGGTVVDLVLPIRVVHVLGEVVVVAVVDVDVAAAPVAVAPQRRADRHPDAEGERRPGDVAGWIVGVRRICGVRPSPVDHGRVVGRHIDHLRI